MTDKEGKIRGLSYIERIISHEKEASVKFDPLKKQICRWKRNFQHDWMIVLCLMRFKHRFSYIAVTVHLTLLSWSSFYHFSTKKNFFFPIFPSLKQRTAMTGACNVPQWLSSFLGKRIGWAEDWTIDFRFQVLSATVWTIRVICRNAKDKS